MAATSDKVFMDSVHGCISMPSECVKIIDTPEFQRLRFVKQLGVGYFVYPGASHNRFEHSIGVSHLAGKLVEALKSRQEELEISDCDVLCVKLAGLCHDLGHGPFSHLWDQFMREHRNPEHEHEKMSCRMLDHIFARYAITRLPSDDINFIKALILGDRDAEDTGRGREKGFLYDIVNNERNGIDVDKWDYLLRDSHHLGIPVIFSYERLIQYARVIEVGNEGRQICFRDKVAGDIMDMFSVRYQLHKKAYQHRVCHKLTCMLVDAFKEADPYVTVAGSQGQERRLALSQCADDMKAFAQLTDDVVQRILWEPTDDLSLHKAKRIIKDVYRRRLYVDVGQVVVPEQNPDCMRTMKEAMDRHLQASEQAKRCLKVTEAKLSYGSKGSDPLERVRFYSKEGDRIVERELLPHGIFPSKYTCSFLHVLSTSSDKNVLTDLKNAFRLAREELELTEVRGGILSVQHQRCLRSVLHMCA